jgi:enamine deaminase RidA (YjgF/YER057c/UK114 family)
VGSGLVFAAGQVSIDEHGEVVGEGEPDRQADQCFRNLEAALVTAGSDLASIVHLRCYLVRAEDYPSYAAGRERWLGTHRPAATGIVIDSLLIPTLLFEVEAVALARADN